MANSNAICSSFKRELMVGTHNFTTSTGDVFKLALYTSSASYGASTTAYSATNEATGTGYTAGGNTLTNVTPTLDSTTAITDFADTTWTTSTITARGAMIYNSSKANVSVMTLDFGSDKISSAGDFSVQMPSPAAATAIIRIA
jgi:hypothetical protein